MGQLELLAAPFALATWSTKAQQRPILFFLDNDSASSNLIKGYSPKVDSSVIVGEFWLMAASLKSSIYIDRVESKSNLADGPSRLNFDELYQMGGRWKEPNTDRLGSPQFALLAGLAHQQRGEKRQTSSPDIRGENIEAYFSGASIE